MLLRTTRITASALAGSAELVGDAVWGAPQAATTKSANARRATPRTIGMRSDVTEVDAGCFQNTFALDKEGQRNQAGVGRDRITDGVDQPDGVAVERHLEPAQKRANSPPISRRRPPPPHRWSSRPQRHGPR